jgi:HSP20 family protein
MSHDEPPDRMRGQLDRMYQELFEPTRWMVAPHMHTWRPPTDVFETADTVVVRVEIAGVRESDIHVSLTDRLLVISGLRRDPSPKVAYHQMEVRYGEFRTEVYLHWSIDQSDIHAVYSNGFLQVELPKAAKRHIRIVESE